jgi:hypothetical protein
MAFLKQEYNFVIDKINALSRISFFLAWEFPGKKNGQKITLINRTLKLFGWAAYL